MTHTHNQDIAQATFTLESLHCPECADAVERALRTNPHITNVHLDWAKNEAHVSFHSGMITEDDIAQRIAATGCDCAPSDSAQTTHDHTHHPAPAQRKFERLKKALSLKPKLRLSYRKRCDRHPQRDHRECG